MLIATTDVSPVNRINAKVTNTKLPWEAEGGKFMEVGSIEAWTCDLETSKFVKIWSKGYPQEAMCISYDKASKKILIGLDDGVVDFIRMTETSYEDIVCEKIHNSRVCGLGYDSLTNIVFSVSQDKILRLSHGTSLALVLGIPHKEPLMSLFKDIINKRLFIGTKIGEILIYDISHVFFRLDLVLKAKAAEHSKKQQRRLHPIDSFGNQQELPLHWQLRRWRNQCL